MQLGGIRLLRRLTSDDRPLPTSARTMVSERVCAVHCAQRRERRQQWQQSLKRLRTARAGKSSTQFGSRTAGHPDWLEAASAFYGEYGASEEVAAKLERRWRTGCLRQSEAGRH